MASILRWLLVGTCYLSLGSAATRADSGLPDPSLTPPKNPEARAHFLRGNRLYRIREFAKAVDEYKAGSLIEPAMVFLYNLGQSHRKLGNHEEALWYYEGFLHRGKPAGEVRRYVEQFIAEMKAELEQKAKDSPTKPLPESQPSSGLAAPLKPTGPPPPLRIVREPWHRDRMGLALAGAGVVTVGVSGALFLSAHGLEVDANRDGREQRRTELRDRSSTRRLLGTIAGVAGVGLTLGGIVKLAIRPEREVPRRAAFEIILSDRSIALSTRF